MASITLPDDVVVTARALGSAPGRVRPEFGVYLCGRRAQRRRARRWTGTWRSTWLDWPPLRGPRDTTAAVAALAEAHHRASLGERVEIACGSGRSRTATALAALAVCGGLDAEAAADWLRGAYPRGLLTPSQRHWLTSAAPRLRAA